MVGKLRLSRIIILILLFLLPVMAGMVLSDKILPRGLSFLPARQVQPPVSPPPTIKIAEMQRSPLFLPAYLALEEKYFTAAGVQVEILGSQQTDVLQADLVLTTAEELFIPQGKLKGWRAAAVASWRSDAVLLSRTQVSNFNPGQLRGQCLITPPPASFSTVMLEEVLRRHKIRPHRQVTLYSHLPPAVQAAILKAGSAGYLLAEEPQATLWEQSEGLVPVFYLAEAHPPVPVAVLAVRPGSENSIIPLLPPIRQAIEQGIRAAVALPAPELAAKLHAYFPTLSQEQLSHLIARLQKQQVFTPPDDNPASLLEELGRCYRQAGEIIRLPRVEEFYFTSPASP